MRIGIDCRMWSQTGIGRYISNLVTELAAMDTENEYVLFVLDADYESINLPENFRKVRANIHWYTFAEQLFFPFILYREKLNILFVPNFNAPILYFKKFVVTVHDLTVLHIKTGKASKHFYPYYLLKRLAVNFPLYYCKVRASAIFMISKYVLEEYAERFNVNRDKLIYAPCAVSSKFRRIDTDEVFRTLQMYDIKQPYIFYVGNAHPHKNINALIEAFKIVKQQKPNLNLVLGGRDGFFYKNLREELEGEEILDSIKFTGFILDEDLPALYSGAEAYVNPSLFEGFGLQLLEAFACGTKVVCSNTTSLPEVGGNIPYYFNPRDKKEMAVKIISCLDDNNEERIQAGYDRVKDFSWRKSAQIIYETCISI